MKKTLTAKRRYERLETDRFTFLDRARRSAELTIPTLVPPLGHTKTTKYYTPWQGIGARGVNNLASKLLLSLLPPNSPFFKLSVDDFTVQELTGGDKDGRAKLDAALNKVERAVQTEIENSGDRAAIFLMLKHLIVAGNVFAYLPKEGGIRVFCLDSYVAVRDPKGNLLEVVTKEVVNPDALDDDIYDLLQDMQEKSITMSEAKADEKRDADKNEASSEVVEIYTRFVKSDGRWKMCQEVNGMEVPGSQGSWPEDKCPFLCLRWAHVENEDYGRSYVEEYLGDLIALEGLSKAIVEAAASTAKIVWLVSPNGVTRATDITEAESGDAITGHKDDIHCLQADKQADMRIASDTIKTITERLSYAFLLASSVQRKGERVTAEEIRYMASELEDALGGVYSVFSQEFQLPYIHRVMDRMQKDKRLPDLPKRVVKPTITTGLEALGRGHDLSKYSQLLQMVSQVPEAVALLNMQNLVTRIGTALMIDMTGLVKTEDEVAGEQQGAQQATQQQQMTELAGKAAPAAIKAVSDHAMAGKQAGPSPVPKTGK